MPTAWRIVKTRYAAHAFDGEGARLYGGRWSGRGHPLIYTSETIALAALEVLVHLNESRVLQSYSLCSVRFDESFVKRIDRGALPASWREYPAPAALQQLGGDWIASGSSAVLEVPSVIVESESNYLINPAHTDFKFVKKGRPMPFVFDRRLLRK